MESYVESMNTAFAFDNAYRDLIGCRSCSSKSGLGGDFGAANQICLTLNLEFLGTLSITRLDSALHAALLLFESALSSSHLMMYQARANEHDYCYY